VSARKAFLFAPDYFNSADEQPILADTIKPTQILVVMEKHPVGKPHLRHPRLTREFCIRAPNL